MNMRNDQKKICVWMMCLVVVLMVCAGVSFAAGQETSPVFASTAFDVTSMFRVSPYALAADATTTSSSGSTEKKAMSADDVAKNLANPNSDLAQLKFQNRWYSYDGSLPKADNESNYTLLFQPIFPFSIGENTNGDKQTIFFRPAFPILHQQPVFKESKGSFSDVSAVGDIGFDLAYGVSQKDGLLWAVGMVGTLPTATDEDVTGGQLRLGPEVLLAQTTDWGLYGVFPSHQWDVTGWRDGYYSTTKIQPFVTLLPGGGWSIDTAPEILFDWKKNDWTIPLNLKIGRTIKMGDTPVKVELELNYYAQQPDEFGPDWMIGFNFTPVVANFLETMFK